MRRTAVGPEEYTEDYFLNYSGGDSDFKKSWGKTVNEKYHYALDQLKIISGVKILDVGCGRGEMLVQLANRGARVTGVDYSPVAIRLAKKAKNRQPDEIRKRIKIIKRDIQKLPFGSKTFDRVLFLDVVEHLTPQEGIKTLKEIRRVLKKDGFLVLHTWPNRFYIGVGYHYWSWPLICFLILLKGGKRFPPWELEPSPYDKKVHINLQDYFSLRKMLELAGFKAKFKLAVEPSGSNDIKNRLAYCLYKMKPFSLTWPLNIIFCDHLWAVAYP